MNNDYSCEMWPLIIPENHREFVRLSCVSVNKSHSEIVDRVRTFCGYPYKII